VAKLKPVELKALLEALELAEKYKTFQVVKRNIMRKYGLLGRRADRIATALLYKVYRLQGVLDDIVREVVGVEPLRLPAFLRQAYRLVAYLALFDEVGDRELAEQVVAYSSRIAAKRFAQKEADRLLRFYRKLSSGAWQPSRQLEEEMRLLLPRIIVERLRTLLGTMAEIEEFAKAVNNPRPVYGLRVNTLKASIGEVISELERIGVEVEPSRRIPNHVRYRGRLPYDELAILKEGKVVPQDEASAAAGYLLDPQPGERVVDMCAAPGGKTTHIAELQRNKGLVVALEIFSDRISRLVELAKRTSTIQSIVPVVGDALRASSLIRGADKVLLDPPCSSTGAIARHPEARWRLTEKTLQKLAEKQYRMLIEAVKLVPRGGRILYTVCSVMPEEGEYLVKKVLETQPVELIPLKGPYSPSPLLPGTMRAWPHRHGTTGFFYALMEKR
jgi:16S rRNA (cytosine967-C5)-methyltransferase